MRLADRLYQEVDDSCALCGLRGIELLTIHHLDGDPTNNVYENTIVLCYNCHKRFHDAKGITDAHVRDRKRHLIHKTMTTYGVSALKIAARKGGLVALPFLLYHLVEFGYMDQKEDVMTYAPDGTVGHGTVGLGADGNPQSDALAMSWFSITDEGRAFVATWLD